MRARTALTGLLLFLCLTAAASAQPVSREILVSRLGFVPSVAVTGDGNMVWTDYVPDRFEYRVLFRQIRR